MSHSNSLSIDDALLEKMVAQLETRLRIQPDNKRLVSKLLKILDMQSPKVSGTSPYSQCQRALNHLFHEKVTQPDGQTLNFLLDDYHKWQSVLNAHDINRDVPVAQLFEGAEFEIHDELAHCGSYLKNFEETGVISNICFDCYKVQILPDSVVSMIGLYFILRNLKLERDNYRKCMIELRDTIPYPYKGYIYCQSEDEAKECRYRLKVELQKNGLGDMYCGISHGCSEYGLKYPDFKYSADGAHRHFERPSSWTEIEKSFEIAIPPNRMHVPTNSNSKFTVRDMIGFETWIRYAEIIGDETHKRLAGDTTTRDKLRPFSLRVAKQSQKRKAQLTELQGR